MSKITAYIERVKLKSEEEKRRIVFMWTAIIITLIFLVWIVSFSLSVVNNEADLARLQQEAEVTAKAQLAQNATSSVSKNKSIFSRVGNFVADGASAVSEGFWTVGSWLHQ